MVDKEIVNGGKYMKVAAISDIHANYLALEAILRYIDREGIKDILFLGDYITDCPYPYKTMNLLYECLEKYNCHFIRGNREDYLIKHHNNPNDEWKYSSSTGSLLYTYLNITKKDIDFFKAIPVSKIVTFKNHPHLFMCHGSPTKTKDWLYKKDDLLYSYIKDIDCDYFIFGHSHRAYSTNILGKTVNFCPSAGLPANKKTDAQFILLESDGTTWKSQVISLPYNIEKLIHDFYESGLLDKARIWTKCILKQLSTGIEWYAKCLSLARNKANSDSIYDIIPERYWEEAARELQI